MEITQELVKSYFDYRDGILYWKIRPAQNVFINDSAGSLRKGKNGDKRCVIGINGINYLRYRIVFLMHKGYLPKIVDHKDLNPLNDKIENLREATHAQNVTNRKSAKNSSSKYLGVTKKPTNWRAVIQINGKFKHLGMFNTEELAALAYNEAAKIHHGEFANLNVIQNTLMPV